MTKETKHTYTVTVKLKPYLQEYLQCKMNDDVNCALSNFVGVVIHPFLKLLPKDADPFSYTRADNYNKDDFMEITLPWFHKNLDRRGNVFMPAENFKDFERIIHIHFWDLFFNYVDDKIRYNKRIKKVICQFCVDYQIRFDHLTYEMLKKAYYRKKKRKALIKFSGILSLSCPCFFLM